MTQLVNSSVISEKGSSLYVYVAALVAAISGLLFGFDIAVINGALIFLEKYFNLTSSLQVEFATSSLLVGCILGAMVAGPLSDRWGRKYILGISALLFGLSAIGAAIPTSLTQFVVARLLGGIAVGSASLLAPLYIAEISPPHIRGRLVSLNQMAIVSGILLSYLTNYLLSFYPEAGWRWMFASAAVPSFILFLALFFVPESPRWLTENGKESRALWVLARINGRIQAELEFKQIKETIAEESGTLAELFQPGFRRPLIIAVVMAILQQVTGINTVLFYGSKIFKDYMGGQTDSSAVGLNVVVGVINFLTTIIAIYTIDKLGRRPLLILSAAGMGISHALLGICFIFQPPPIYAILGSIFVCVLSFGVGMGPGVWVLISEIFPTRIRGRAMSIATVSLWCACVLLTFTFLTLVETVGVSRAFWVYSSMCLITVIFVWKFTPETKGKTLEEIEHLWRH
jgi:MFS transporter, SP family, arabinose:H+ symporter